MRRALEPDHDLVGEDEPPRDLVLGAPALLGVFLTVVLVCAVCFGFGYSSGHGFHFSSTGNAAAPALAASQPADTPAGTDQAAPPTTDDSELPPPAAVAKPSPGVEPSTASAPSQTASAAPAPAPVQLETASPVARPNTVPVKPAPATIAATQAAPVPAKAAAPALAAPAHAAAAQSLGLMVQIAAVTQAADAETLSRALRHDGYSAIVRTTDGDPYFHVQVGPFATWGAAQAMRARLAASGYTAFIRH